MRDPKHLKACRYLLKMQDQPTRKQIMVQRDRSVSTFVNNMQKVLTNVLGKDRRDRDLQAMSDKFSVLRKEDPVHIVIIAGPYIWKYREEINREDVNFFLRNNFEEDIKQAHADASVAEISELTDVTILMEKAKRVWHSFIPDEQRVIMKLVKGMLQAYAGYVSATRALSSE